MLHRKIFLPLSIVVACLVADTLSAIAADRFITVASTTSTENSGLFHYLLPLFQQDTGIEVRVVAVGTGQAIELAQRGDADVLFVHHKPSEEKFIAEGFGVARFDVMYNDFVMVERGNAGRCSGASTASAVTRPSAWYVGTISVATRLCRRSSKVRRATSGAKTLKNSGIAHMFLKERCAVSMWTTKTRLYGMLL